MQKQKKSRTPLIVGIVAALVLLAVLMVVVLTQCDGGTEAGSTSAPAATTETSSEVPTYELYWNLDRAEYDGKSEAGMSSRMPEEDGYFHIRFFLDGQEVTLRTAERKVVNRIDVMDLMGLVFDENGLIVDVVEPEDMPLELVGYKFFVQSVGGRVIKLNSSDTMAGMELLLECTDATSIYDMSGMSGPAGCTAEPIPYDRVIAVQNLAGELTHVFLYDRSNYMLTHEGECQHCGQTVTWSEWTKAEAFPDKSGHYQLRTDVQLKGQVSLSSDVKLCLDLNGYTVTGKDNTRMISLHNPGIEFALMDTSEGQTGRMVGHSTASPQGGIVWVRYGAFHMYGGTLDGSDMVSRLNGTVVQVPANSFFYMHGGTIIGGTAAPQYQESTGKYTYGLGGAVQVSGTMRMYGGTIRDGKAPAAYYYSGGKLTISRGMGGNIFLSSGAVLEMTGGQILYGYAGNAGGNIMMDGTAELILSGGTISGGWTDARVANKHGGNVYCPGKGTIRMSGGAIEGGANLTGAGGNLYLAGTMTMTGGCIFGGETATSGGNIHMAGNGRLTIWAGSIWGGTAGNNAGNINVSGSAALELRGGTITGGVAKYSGGNISCNTSGTFLMSGGIVSDGIANGSSSGHGGGNIALVADGASVNITGGTVTGGQAVGGEKDGVITGGDGGNININRGTVSITGGTITGGDANGNGGGIYVGWNSTGLTLGGSALVYGNGVDIVRSANTAAGKSRITLDGWKGNGENGALVIDRLSGVAGSVIAVPARDVLTETDLANFSGTRLALPLRISGSGELILSETADLGSGDHFHCVCGGELEGIEGHTCADVGYVSVNAARFRECWSSNDGNYYLMGSLNLRLTEDITLETEYALSGNTLNLDLNGHTITMTGNGRITANGGSGVLNLSDCTGSGRILAAEGCRTSILYTYKGTMNIYGGTVDASLCAAGTGGAIRVGYNGDGLSICGGTVIGSKKATNGGTIYCDTASTIQISGGTVTGGCASSAGGGNIFLNHNDCVLTISGGTVCDGSATGTGSGKGLGGNIHVARGTLNLTGGTITGGSAKGQPTADEAVGLTGGIYVAYNTKALNLSGDARICGNTGSDIYLTSKTDFALTLGQWTGNGEKGAPVIRKLSGAAGSLLVKPASGVTLTESDAEKFTSGHEGLNIGLAEGRLVLKTPFVHDHCVCGGLEGHDCTEVRYTEVKGNDDWQTWFDSGNTLTSDADLVLTGDVTLDAEYKLGGHTLNLCLNGHTITMTGNGRITANGGTGVLNLTDCGNGGIAAAEGCRTGILYTYKGTMNIYGGTVDASGCASGTGGAVRVGYTGDSFTLYGGKLTGSKSGTNGGTIHCVTGGSVTILGGTVTDGKVTGSGGNIYMEGGTLTILGGSVSNGEAAGTGGGNIFMANGALVIGGGTVCGGRATGTAANKGVGGNIHAVKGTIALTGGTVTGGVASGVTSNAADIRGVSGGIYMGYNHTSMTLSGTAKLYGNTGADLWLTSNTNYALSLGQWAGNGGEGALKLGKSAGVGETVLARPDGVSFTADTLANFSCVHEGMELYLNSDGCIALSQLHYHCVCGGALEEDGSHTCEKLLWTELDADGFLALFNENNELTVDANVVLIGDVTLRAEYTLAGHTLNLCLGGKTITMAENGRITANGETGVLNLTDCGGGKILAAENCRAAILYTYKGKLNIYGGTVDASACASGTGGAFRAGYEGDSFTLYGGTILGSRNSTTGGSIYCSAKAAVTISGGTVSGGTATTNGGNIYMGAGTLTICGGTVSGGTGRSGGNIYADGSAVLNITDGEISGGISKGTAAGHGGGNIRIAGTVVMTMTGGRISGGQATGTTGNDGGNVNVNNGTFRFSGGTITGGSATGNGGGIYVGWNTLGVYLSGKAQVCGNTGTDICRSNNTSATKGCFVLGDWEGNGEQGPAVFGSLFTAAGSIVMVADTGVTLTEADLAKFIYAGDFKLALSDGKIVLAQ